jgi:hypothetical protein
MDDFFEDFAQNQRNAADREDNDPMYQMRLRLKRQNEEAKYKRQGLVDSEGNWIDNEYVVEDEDEDEDEDE